MFKIKQKIIAGALLIILIFGMSACTLRPKGGTTTMVSTTDTTVLLATTLPATTRTETTTKKSTTTKKATTKPVTLLKKNPDKTYPYFMAQYSTRFKASDKGRTENIRLASKAINGVVLEPGAVFSFNAIVGQRTAARGYKEANVIQNRKFEKGLGGGVCQVSTTLFNGVLLSNLKIRERHQHSLKVSYVPSCRDAAISWKSQDLCFENNYDTPIQIVMIFNKQGSLTVQIYAKEKVKVPKVTLNTSKKGETWTLERKANGVLNYTCRSKYQQARE